MAAAHLVPSAHATYIFAQLSRHVKNAFAKARRSNLAAKRAIAFRQGIFATNRREPAGDRHTLPTAAPKLPYAYQRPPRRTDARAALAPGAAKQGRSSRV